MQGGAQLDSVCPQNRNETAEKEKQWCLTRISQHLRLFRPIHHFLHKWKTAENTERKTICLVLMRVETSKEVEQMRNDRVTSASGGRGGTFWCFRWRFSSCRNLSRSFSSCFLTKSSQGVNWKHDFQWLELLPKKPIKNSSSANANVCGS